MARKQKKSSRDRKIALQSWKTTWPAEEATLHEAISLRERVVKRLRKGNDHERKTARILRRCRRDNRCGSPDCPFCERRRRLKAQRYGAAHTVPPPVFQLRPTVILTRASDIAPERIEWLWPERIALAKLSVIAGDPKQGKSQLAAFLVATVSTGGEWPCHEGRAPLGTVIILSAEDDPGTVIPRLEVANADLSRIHFLDINKVKDGETCRAFDILSDASKLEQEIRRFGDVRLIIIDPITAFLTSTGVQRAAAARLQQLAANLGAAVVAIAHLAKTARRNALAQVMGSFGLVAVTRAIFIVAKEKETDRRLFLMAENNLASARAGLAFKIEPKTTSSGTPTSAVVWDGSVTMSAEEVLASAPGAKMLQPALTDAEDFLRFVLAAGPIAARDIRAEAMDAGIRYSSLRRAAAKLGVKSRRIGGIAGKGGWVWELPDGSSPGDRKARVSQVSFVAE